TRRDADLTKAIYKRIPILIDENRRQGGNPWDVHLTTMFHQSADAASFLQGEKLKDEGGKVEGNQWRVGDKPYLPCYEAKMIHPYDHRAAHVGDENLNWLRRGQTGDVSLVDHQNPEFVVLPRWWVDADIVAKSLGGPLPPVLMSFRKVTSPTNTRTMLAAY